MESGSRSRKQVIQHQAQWLRFAVENNYLDKKLWEPPRKESREIRDLVGETLTQKQLTVPIYDTEIEELLDAISKNRETRAANRWIFALQLLACYGCLLLLHFLQDMITCVKESIMQYQRTTKIKLPFSF